MRLPWANRSFHYVWVSLLCVVGAFVVSVRYTNWRPSSVLPGRVPEGKRVMQRYCGTCHLPVPASALDRDTWMDSVLPVMAPKVGISKYWDKYYPDPNDTTSISASGTEWSQILRYYQREAPDTLRLPDPPASPQTPLPLFAVRTPEVRGDRRAATAMVAVDDSTHHIYSSNTVTESVYRWDRALTSRTSVQSDLLGVAGRFLDGADGHRSGILTSIGGTMRPVDKATGTVRTVDLRTHSSRVIASELPRPVCSVPGDFNQDGLRDWIVCGFGYNSGGLYLVEQQPDGTYDKRIIRDVAGAVDAHVQDFNQDGYPDVMALFGQGNEGVWLFTNDQRGGFDQRSVQRFPPVYGSTDLQLVDFNRDGRLDLLYTSGDNADHSRILKPYHGIYVFLNRGDFQFEQAYFYHLNGATEAIAADFDGDGDLDIGAIAYFATLKDDSAHNFVYLEQDGPLEFTPHVPPVRRYGEWLSMDAGDYDGDGDLDLVLGNYSNYYVSQERTDSGSTSPYPFIVLENQSR